ncbi:hypothetical protein AMV067 [Betaentomopoxvirus amoorei]|uniref:AMV067 n=1 Tax=Amsacta moorei entomopoxvirus TaxID=28321 RepID=Q9EMY2_AMEPV|nr:hypothetical protein AMV067 [Amsacta moorei entomopoxvirus]AAG02773.1 AMV067 [Amsacta moorei entomopoxvirus]
MLSLDNAIINAMISICKNVFLESITHFILSGLKSISKVKNCGGFNFSFIIINDGFLLMNAR